MTGEAQEKLAAVAARLAATRASLRALEQRAAALRQELQRLRAAAEGGAAEGVRPSAAEAEFGERVPTKLLAQRPEELPRHERDEEPDEHAGPPPADEAGRGP